MNTHMATTKGFDWHKVMRSILRITLAALILAFKLAVILGSLILTFFAALFARNEANDAPEKRVESSIPNIGRDHSNEFSPRDRNSV